MCGIAGQVSITGNSLDPDLVLKMSERMKHRGPDDYGYYEDKNVILAHRRLSIIDLSHEGKQPMTNDHGTIWIVYNGEIYNYIEIRKKLEGLGYTFRTNTDTEVILKAYEHWGDACIKDFNGMWAFVIWDARYKRAFFSRDRYGIKPLYFTEIRNTLIFASEIKALLEHPEVGIEPDEEKLKMFLAHGILDDDSRTLYKGISQLIPGNVMIVGRNKDTPTITDFFRFDTRPVSHETHTPQSLEKVYAESLKGFLKDSIRLHLRSDVPVGTCLSGGIDSSSIVMIVNSLLKEEHPESLGEHQKTFSITFDDPGCDERKYIKEVIDAADVDAYCENLGIWPPNIGEVHTLIYTQDGPFPSLSVFAQNRVMALAQGKVKVLLDGQGADELFGGYYAYIAAYLTTLTRSGKYVEAAKECVGASCWCGTHLVSQYRQKRARNGYECLLNGAKVANPRYKGPLNKVLESEMRLNLPALLHWEDRNSMQYSIEARVPFLDYRVVNEAALYPLDMKIRRGATKHILRKAMEGMVPRKILNRRDKRGFDVPEAEWARHFPEFWETFDSDSFMKRSYWDAKAVKAAFEKVREGKAPYAPIFWRIFCVEHWLRLFFDEGSGRLKRWNI